MICAAAGGAMGTTFERCAVGVGDVEAKGEMEGADGACGAVRAEAVELDEEAGELERDEDGVLSVRP